MQFPLSRIVLKLHTIYVMYQLPEMQALLCIPYLPAPAPAKYNPKKL